MGLSRQSKLIVFVAIVASLLEIIDVSIVNVALPDMMGNLGATLGEISMVVAGYAIANAIVLPASAWLGERFGRRRYFLGCILIFTAASVACGLAPNLILLVIFRIFQGLAGGALLPTSQTLIFEQFPVEDAGIAAAIFGMSVSVGPALGPVLGGFLTDTFGWRAIFNINLPLGIMAFFVGLTCIFDREQKGPKREPGALDSIGLALLIAGIGCLQFLLERGQADDWFSSTRIVICAIISAISIPVFVWWEWRAKHPIINIRLFKHSTVHNGVFLSGLLGFFLYGLVFILPVFLTRAFHYDATQIGVLFIPGSLLTMAIMPFVGRMMRARVNPKILIFIGFFSLEICLLLITQFSPMTSEWDMLIMLFVRGFALAFLFVPINSSILSQFVSPEMGEVAGLLNFFRQVGGSMGIAFIATLMSSRMRQNYSNLASHVSLLSMAGRSAYFQTKEMLATRMSRLVGWSAFNRATLEVLRFRVLNQSFMLTFLQIMYVMMVIIALVFIPLYRLTYRKLNR